MVGAAKARIAGACLRMPPQAYSAMSLRPAYFLPANSGLPAFQSEKCVCMPLPLSWKIGLAMKQTVLPCCLPTLRQMYLYHINWSAILSRLVNFMSISLWPAVATSW
jgi:hypothetical protein